MELVASKLWASYEQDELQTAGLKAKTACQDAADSRLLT